MFIGASKVAKVSKHSCKLFKYFYAKFMICNSLSFVQLHETNHTKIYSSYIKYLLRISVNSLKIIKLSSKDKIYRTNVESIQKRKAKTFFYIKVLKKTINIFP